MAIIIVADSKLLSKNSSQHINKSFIYFYFIIEWKKWRDQEFLFFFI